MTRAVALLALALSLPPALAAADSATTDAVFVRDRALWRRPVDRAGDAVKLADLGPSGPVQRLVAAADGSALLVGFDRATAWLDLGAAPSWVYLPCAGPAWLSGDGAVVACPVRGGEVARFQLRGAWQSELVAGTTDVVGFADPAGAGLVSRAGDGLRVGTGDAATATAIAPDGAVAIAPDGRRAVAVFGQGDARVLDSFALAAGAARRKLLDDASPITWSGDSRWLLVQQGDSACAIRAVGGEYKCWDGYVGLGLARDASQLLFTRTAVDGTQELDVAVLAGAHPAAPRVLEHVGGPAVLIPGP